MPQEIIKREQTEDALIAASKADIAGGEDMQIPMLKVMQALSREVVEGEAEVGELVHSLTGESYGDTVQVVIVDAFKGRFFNDTDNNRTYVANREAVCPWEDTPWFGQHFVDVPDAEEQYKARVNAGEIEWGKGPRISTTYNFVGLIIREDGEVENFPVRLSFMRSAAKAGRNWTTLLSIARAPWDVVFEVSTIKAKSKGGQPYTDVRVKQLRRTSDEERTAAVEIAQVIHAPDALVSLHEAEGAQEEKVEPSSEGGLEV